MASPWHTAALVGLILSVALAGTLGRNAGSELLVTPPRSRLLSLYVPILAVNWGLLLYVCRLFRPTSALSTLLGRRWHNVARASVDLVLALIAWALVQAVATLSLRYASVGRNAAVLALLPSTEAERLTWLFVAANVGFCEELVYRGYLQTQLIAFTRSTSIGIALSAVLFGIAHAEQGLGAALSIAVFGLILGVLAQFRHSLLPGILCHIGIDALAAFVR